MKNNEQNDKIEYTKDVNQFYNGIKLYNQHVFDTRMMNSLECDEIYNDVHYYRYFYDPSQ